MSKTNLVKIFLAVMLGGSALWLALRPQPLHPVQVGESAPDFRMPALDPGTQGSISLRNYRHHVVLLNFWATWCPPCVEEMPSLEKFAEKMRGEGVVIIGASVDQEEAALRKFVTDYHLSFPIARDPNQSVASRYGTYKFPETYIIDRDGKVAEKIIDALDWQDPRIIDFVESLAQERRAPGK